LFRKSFQIANPIEEDLLKVYHINYVCQIGPGFSLYTIPMHRYIQIFIVTVKEYFAYRLNFVLWRLRMIISSLITIYLWLAVFDSKTSFGHYSKTEMISYLLYTSLVMTLVASTRTSNLAYEIQSGGIMNLLLKPLSIFGYYATTDAVDKVMNGFFGLLEFGLITYFLHIKLIPPHAIAIFIIFFICAIYISFCINLLLSFIGFWTPEVWAPRFLFMMIVFFVSGTYFPLDLLPPAIYRVFLFTPFPYLYYLPAKTLISGVQTAYIVQQLVCAIVWSGILFFCTKAVWNKGIKEFSFWGK